MHTCMRYAFHVTPRKRQKEHLLRTMPWRISYGSVIFTATESRAAVNINYLAPFFEFLTLPLYRSLQFSTSGRNLLQKIITLLLPSRITALWICWWRRNCLLLKTILLYLSIIKWHWSANKDTYAVCVEFELITHTCQPFTTIFLYSIQLSVNMKCMRSMSLHAD